MQWLLLALTLVITAILERLARATGGPVPVEARATLSLGCLLIAAYIGGALAQRVRLPRIIGYLVVGFVSGPAWLGLIQRDEVQALSVISTGALSLIALSAGSQLSLDAFRGAQRLTLLRVVGGAMVVPFLLVTLVTLTISPWFPLTAHQPFRDALVVALVLGTLAAVASPTVTWALTRDIDARGPLSRGVVNVPIVQTVAVAVCLAVVLAIVRPLASSGAVVPGSAVRVLVLLLGSLAIGAALAMGVAQYVRTVGVGWVLVAFAFIISQFVRLAGLDAVLIALAAGFTLRNTAPAESERLAVELERCAVPLYVVFFALTGAAVRFDPLDELALWPWALLLVALRLNGLRWGLQLAGWRDPAVGAEFSRYGWLGLVSQGGTAVTLAAVLRSAFPEWNVSLEALLVAMIGFHEVAGPICFQWALRRTGEVTERREERDAAETALVVDGDNVVSRV